MSMWRCPHCGTPQAEASRCWVCHRSSTTCSTCRHFRRSIAAQLGYCGLDQRRLPLTGMEMRGCWAPAAARPFESAPVADPEKPADRTSDPAIRLRDFVPVDLLRDRRIVVVPRQPGDERDLPDPAPMPQGAVAAEQRPEGLTLFGEADG
jgi:hypothetical protein